MAQQLRSDIVSQVDCAKNGIEALAMLQQKRYDLVICDLAMPGMDGIVFVKHLAQLRDRPDLFILSSQPDSLLQLVERLAKSLGFERVASHAKPMVIDDIKAAVRCFDDLRLMSGRALPIDNAVAADAVDVLEGLIRKQFTAWYQPQHDIATARIVGVEVLARWNHPRRGVLPPSVFLDTIIESNWINHLNSILLEKALRAQAEWRKAGRNLTISFNLPVCLLAEESLPDRLLNIVESCGGDPGALMLELTETTVADQFSDYLAGAARLKLKGFKLSIDDFGTGYSSLFNLMSVPFDEIKLDRAFVHGAHKNPVARAALESSIALAKRLDIKVVAEGVEDPRDLALLQHQGCSTVQGYLFSRPMAEPMFEKLLLGRN
ncbi:transcriptional regulator [Jeongeupia chitinilytica]|uniref:Transcriptional regulator n=2 Tax=Jeongeupia chitinilytica TaxID=1041641 RepID=A0ABQ3H6G3_9NEIS|nr:transcriptional regulator [Jeongeupia chitinilytica]